MYTNKNCEARQCPEQLLESSGKLYDGMVNAVATWPEEMKAQVLVHVMCLYAVALKAAERDPSKGHPLIKGVSKALASYGIKINNN